MKFIYVKKSIKRFLRENRGGVTVEYILLCSMIALASIFASITFSRCIISMFHVNGYALFGEHDKAEKAKEEYEKDRKKDFEKAREYTDSLNY